MEEREPPTTQNWLQFDGWNFAIVDYKRNEPEFASIMCYYHIDKSARRIKELGYNIDNTVLKDLFVDPHGYGTYFQHKHNTVLWFIPAGKYTYITFKDEPNAVSSSDDGDIIWHEYGHAMQHHFGVGLRWDTAYKESRSIA